MNRIAAIIVPAVAISFFGASVQAAFGAKNDAYSQKKAECKQEAKGKHFGVHLIKRDRWIKNCIAGRPN